MAAVVTQEEAFAYAELLEILSFTEEADVNKIPKKLISVFQKHALSTYEKHINPNLSLEEQNLSEKTVSLIVLLTLNYWCETEQQKEQIKNKLKENEIRKTRELEEKYSYDKLFNNTIEETSSDSVTELTEDNQIIENTINTSNLPMDYNSFPWYKKAFIKFKNWLYALFNKTKNPT